MTSENKVTKTITSENQGLDLIRIYREIWKYRSFLLNLTKRELEVRYKGSVLGVMWSLLNPVLSLLVYFFIFKKLSGTQIPNFLIYLFSGVVAWLFCIQTINKSTTILKQSSRMMNKVYFPLEILVVSNIVSNLVNFCVAFFLVILVVIFTGSQISFNLLWFPVLAIIHSTFLYSTAMLLSSLGILVRDTEIIVGTLVSLLFFSTPVFYKPELITSNEIAIMILSYHPIAAILSLYRDIVHEATHPDWTVLLYISLFTIFWYCICHFVFNRFRSLIYDLI